MATRSSARGAGLGGAFRTPTVTVNKLPSSQPNVAPTIPATVGNTLAPTPITPQTAAILNLIGPPAPPRAEPPKPLTKTEQVAQYSAPAGTVLNANVVDKILSSNIDKGDPNIVTGDKLKIAEQKGQIDPSLGNLLSINASVAKGAAALGVVKTESPTTLGGAKTTNYSGDLVGAAKSLGIDTTAYTKQTTGAMGSQQTTIDKAKLYTAVNDRANQLGIYSVTERVPGTPGDNAAHTTTFYQNTNGVLQPLKNADGTVATTTFKAPTFQKDEGFIESVVSGVKGIATELAPIISLALPNLGLTGLQLLAAQSAQAIATGANPTQVLKGAIGSLAAAQVPQYLDELKAVSSASPALKAAINNAAVQATFAAFTDQNIALNAIAGAIGGSAAELSKDLGDPALQKAIGEFTKNKALGMSDLQAGMAAAQDYAQSVSGKKSADRTAAQEQVIDAFAQGKSPGVGTQLGEATAAAGMLYSDEQAAREAAALGIELPSVGKSTANIIADKELPAVTVTGTREPVILTPTLTPNLGLGGVTNRQPPTNVLPNLDIANLISQGAATTGEVTTTPTEITDTTQATKGTSTTGEDTTTRAVGDVSTGKSLDQDIINITGIGSGTGAGTGTAIGTGTGTDIGTGTDKGTGTGAGTTGAGEGTGAEGTGTGTRAGTGTGTGTGEGTGGEGTGGTGTGGDGAGGDGTGSGTSGSTETIILDLISGGGVRPRQRIPTDSEAESMAALTQALRIGDPGEALFGGKLGRRKNIWNVESLRLRDEIGG